MTTLPKLILVLLLVLHDFCVGISEYKEPPIQFATTVVSCYFRMKSKHSEDQYDKWISNFMSLDAKVVIYGDSESINHLQTKWPSISLSRIYIQREIVNFVTSQWDWSFDLSIDEEISVGHSINLYKIWSEKIFMVADTITNNPFSTDTFVWVDIGCFRKSSNDAKTFNGFPDKTRFDNSKVTFMQIQPFTTEEKLHLETVDSRFRKVDRIGGTIFAGGKLALLSFRNLYEDIISEFKSTKVFAGKDQSLYAFLVLRYPKLFQVVDTNKVNLPNGFDIWFSLQIAFSSANPLTDYAIVTYTPTKASADAALRLMDSIKQVENEDNQNNFLSKVTFISILLNGNLENDEISNQLMYFNKFYTSSSFHNQNNAKMIKLNMWAMTQYKRILFIDAFSIVTKPIISSLLIKAEGGVFSSSEISVGEMDVIEWDKKRHNIKDSYFSLRPNMKTFETLKIQFLFGGFKTIHENEFLAKNFLQNNRSTFNASEYFKAV